MRAADRCKAHYQGDKCRLAVGHEGEWHDGTHTRFTVDGRFTPNVVVTSPTKLRGYSRIMRKQALFLEAMFGTKVLSTPHKNVVK
jgi:hypothetical protein